MDKTVRGCARTERGNTRGGATKKREISPTLLSINLHFSVQYPDICLVFCDCSLFQTTLKKAHSQGVSSDWVWGATTTTGVFEATSNGLRRKARSLSAALQTRPSAFAKLLWGSGTQPRVVRNFRGHTNHPTANASSDSPSKLGKCRGNQI